MKKNIETKHIVSEAKRVQKAAPKMLDILNRIVLLSRLDCKNPKCMCVQCDVMRTAKQIIAQAEGKRK